MSAYQHHQPSAPNTNIITTSSTETRSSIHLPPVARTTSPQPRHLRYSHESQRPPPDPRYYSHVAHRNPVQLPSRPQSAVLREHQRQHVQHRSSPHRLQSPPDRSSPPSNSAASSIVKTDTSMHQSLTIPPQAIRKSPTLDDRSLFIQHDHQVDRDTAPSRASTQGSSSHAPSSHHVISTYAESDSDDEDDENRGPTTRQTVKSLLHLALTALPLSIAIWLYAIFALTFALLASPFRLCMASRSPLSTNILELLLPPLNLQLRCIHVRSLAATPSRRLSSSQMPFSSADAIERAEACFPCTSGGLVLIHLLAPAVALPLMFCAWAMGVAWALGAIVSDESAGDVRDEQGFAEKVVAYWARWLGRDAPAVESGSRASYHHNRRGTRPEMVQTYR